MMEPANDQTMEFVRQLYNHAKRHGAKHATMDMEGLFSEPGVTGVIEVYIGERPSYAVLHDLTLWAEFNGEERVLDVLEQISQPGYDGTIDVTDYVAAGERAEKDLKRIRELEKDLEEAKGKADLFRESMNDANFKTLILEGALDKIKRITADPVFRFYAAPRSKQEILMIAEDALREAREHRED